MINMSWREVLKEESARDYVLNRASSGKPMGDALREFAQKFPDKTPPPEIVEQSVKNMEKIEQILQNLDAQRKRMEEAKIRHEQRGKELEARANMSEDERFKNLFGRTKSELMGGKQ